MQLCKRCTVTKEDNEFFRKEKLCKVCNKCNSKLKKYAKNKGAISIIGLARKELKERRKVALENNRFICGCCKLEKTLDNFPYTGFNKPAIGNSYMCKECNKLMHRFCKVKKLGMSKIELLDMYEIQNKSCAICKTPLNLAGTEKLRATTLCVDHDHSTGKVRGLLCNNCNRGIGFLQDKANIVYTAYKYLIAHVKSDELLEKPEEVNQQPS